MVAEVAALRRERLHLTDSRSSALPDPAGKLGWQVGHAKALAGSTGQRTESLERHLQVDGRAEGLRSFRLSDQSLNDCVCRVLGPHRIARPPVPLGRDLQGVLSGD